MDWNIDLTMEFLSLYENEPLIWNPMDEHHKNRNFVQDAWQRISEVISADLSVKHLK